MPRATESLFARRHYLSGAIGIWAFAACSPAQRPFDKQVLDTAFRSEGVAVFDVDNDGHADIVTDQYWYAGPGLIPHEIRTPETYDPATSYSHCQAAFSDDVD